MNSWIRSSALMLLLSTGGSSASANSDPLVDLAALAATRVEALETAPGGEAVLAVLRTRDATYTDDFVGSRHRILLHIDVPTSRMRRLASECEDVRRLAWSPDGGRIAHFAQCSGSFGVAIRSFPDGRLHRWIELHGEGSNPIGEVADIVWSREGTHLAVVHDPDLSWQERFIRRTTTSIADLPAPIVIDSQSARTPLMSIQGFDGSFFGQSRKRVIVIDPDGEVRGHPPQPDQRNTHREARCRDCRRRDGKR